MFFRCPCLICPTCGHKWHRKDTGHPLDGIAYCTNCHREWWAHVGRHPTHHATSKADVAAMKAYDDAVMAEARRSV